MVKFALSFIAGFVVTLLSTFAGKRSASATYPEIMGCENGCQVVATGWPLVFIRDYLGMSVVNRADILEVWVGGDRFAWAPFLLNLIFWSGLVLAALGAISKRCGTESRAGKRIKS